MVWPISVGNDAPALAMLLMSMGSCKPSAAPMKYRTSPSSSMTWTRPIVPLPPLNQRALSGIIDPSPSTFLLLARMRHMRFLEHSCLHANSGLTRVLASLWQQNNHARSCLEMPPHDRRLFRGKLETLAHLFYLSLQCLLCFPDHDDEQGGNHPDVGSKVSDATV